jgi:hypothetical protein
MNTEFRKCSENCAIKHDDICISKWMKPFMRPVANDLGILEG